MEFGTDEYRDSFVKDRINEFTNPNATQEDFQQAEEEARKLYARGYTNMAQPIFEISECAEAGEELDDSEPKAQCSKHVNPDEERTPGEICERLLGVIQGLFSRPALRDDYYLNMSIQEDLRKLKSKL